MDLVPNHSSDLCEWFKDSVNQVNGKGDWYIWEDPIWDGSVPNPPNNWVGKKIEFIVLFVIFQIKSDF